MKKIYISILLASMINITYADNCGVVFTDVYTQLCNRCADSVSGYGSLQNLDNIQHIITAVSAVDNKSKKALKKGSFFNYPAGGLGNNGPTQQANIVLAAAGTTGMGGVNLDSYIWQPSGAHFTLQGFPTDAPIEFGTDYDPSRTLNITFEIDVKCSTMLENVPIRDRMQSTPPS